MRWRLAVALLVGFLLGQLCSGGRSTEAQQPRLMFVATSSGPVAVQGSTAGAVTVNVQ